MTETDASSDFFLRGIPDVKISKPTAAIKKREPVREELQCLRISTHAQEEILNTLKYIHGPDFKLNDVDNYENQRSSLHKKYWVNRGGLVIKGACDFSNTDDGLDETERLKKFGLLRLVSYGFHETHCIEALDICKGDIEDSLYLLYSKYFNISKLDNDELVPSENELLDLRSEEKVALDSIYEKSFSTKLENVWIVNVKLDYIVEMFHKKEIKSSNRNRESKKDKCRNFVRGHCKFGKNCRFSHEEIKPVVDPEAHLNNYDSELEIRFPAKSKYPYEPPLIFLRTNIILPHLVNLHITKKLLEEAKLLAQDGISSIYSVTELLLNEEVIKEHLKTEISFIPPNQKLIPTKSSMEENIVKPSHYTKGLTNRDLKKSITSDELNAEDKKIINDFKNKLTDIKYKKMSNVRKQLPAWNFQEDILETLEKSQVIVVSGETGCGKSTQVPQFILDNWARNYGNEGKSIKIICTQPRRISAIGVAERVSDERVEKIGNTVGYSIRLESKVSSRTRLLFCTTGILLRNLEDNPTLPDVTHIIVDEVHERSEESDFLLLILKELLPIRPDLKVILMSATMNSNLFSNYFGSIPLISIPGRTFPVEQFFLEDILEETGYIVEYGSQYSRKLDMSVDEMKEVMESTEIISRQKPKNNVPDERLKFCDMLARYEDYSKSTCKNLFLMDNEKINNELIEVVLSWIVSGDHDYPRKGSILVFLPGFAEITALFDELNSHPEFGKRNGKYIILPLHSSLTSTEQSAIFMKPTNDRRKIILSTNLAETSVTIEDCVFVIDSGKMKETRFDSNRNLESLDTVWVTQANALQRKGRAGRVMPGVCIHLYSSHRFHHNMLKQPIPEIQRIPLEKLLLHIMILPHFGERSVKQVLESFIEPPQIEQIDTAMVRLQNVGAVDKNNELTSLGHHLAMLPVDVRIGKLILYGAIFGCVDSALTIAASLNYKSPFISPFLKRDEANAKKREFSLGYSDQITVLVAYKKWLEVYKKNKYAASRYASENYLCHQTLLMLASIKHQFLEHLVYVGFVAADLKGFRNTSDDLVLKLSGSSFNKNGNNIVLLASILCAALYPNIIKILTPTKSFEKSSVGAIPKKFEAKDLKFTTMQETVFMHPSSVNYVVGNYPSPYLVYQEKVRTSKLYFRNCTMVPVIPLVLFSGSDLEISVQDGSTFVSLNEGWILFRVEEHQIAEMVKMLRYELFELLEEKIKDPLLNLLNHDKGKRIISTILTLING